MWKFLLYIGMWVMLCLCPHEGIHQNLHVWWGDCRSVVWLFVEKVTSLILDRYYSWKRMYSIIQFLKRCEVWFFCRLMLALADIQRDTQITSSPMTGKREQQKNRVQHCNQSQKTVMTNHRRSAFLIPHVTLHITWFSVLPIAGLFSKRPDMQLHSLCWWLCKVTTAALAAALKPPIIIWIAWRPISIIFSVKIHRK